MHHRICVTFLSGNRGLTARTAAKRAPSLPRLRRVIVDTPAVRAAPLPSTGCAALLAARSCVAALRQVSGDQAVPVLAGFVEVPDSISPTHANFAPWEYDVP